MEKFLDPLIDSFRDAARGGITLGRAAFKVGRATIKIVVKIVFAK